MINVDRLEKGRAYFKNVAKEAIGITAILGFVVGLYSYALLIELIQMPILAILTVFAAVARNNPAQASVEKSANFLLAMLGFTSFSYSVWQVVEHFGDVATWSTIRDLLSPIALTFAFLPFLYLLFVYMSYQQSFAGLLLACPDDRLMRYAKWNAVVGFRFDLDGVNRWKREFMRTRPNARGEVRKSINDVKSRLARERHPPQVSPEDGWSPYSAKDFLASEGVATDDYHPSVDGWYAQSRLMDIDRGRAFANNVAYYVEGDETTATRLKLVLNVNEPSEPGRAEKRFQALGRILLEKALPVIPDQVAQGVRHLTALDADVRNQWRVQLDREEFGGGIPGGYTVGVLLSSSNARTWTPHQDEDLTMRIYGATFAPATRVIDLGTIDVVAMSDLIVVANVNLPRRPDGDRNDAIFSIKGGKMLLLKRGEVDTGALTIARSDCASWSFQTDPRPRYGGTEARWFDRETGEQRFEEASTGLQGPKKRLRHVLSSATEAKSAASAEAHRMNRATGSGSIELAGMPEAAAEMNVELVGFRPEINGLWQAKTVTHEIGDAYTTRIELEAPEAGKKPP